MALWHCSTRNLNSVITLHGARNTYASKENPRPRKTCSNACPTQFQSNEREDTWENREEGTGEIYRGLWSVHPSCKFLVHGRPVTLVTTNYWSKYCRGHVFVQIWAQFTIVRGVSITSVRDRCCDERHKENTVKETLRNSRLRPWMRLPVETEVNVVELRARLDGRLVCSTVLFEITSQQCKNRFA